MVEREYPRMLVCSKKGKGERSRGRNSLFLVTKGKRGALKQLNGINTPYHRSKVTEP